MTYCPACNRTIADRHATRCEACAAPRPERDWPIDRRLGTVVAGGQYRVLRRLGAGGFGTVYEVETLVGGLRRALKVLHVERAQHARTRDRFINEAVVLEQMNHPNVARCYAAGLLDDGHEVYLLLELIDGLSLSSLLESADGTAPPFDPLRAARIGKQMASGLVAVHASGVLHRDLTPRNVLISGAGTTEEKVTLVDFGVADALEPETVSERALFGTPRFIPPEAFIAGVEPDARYDLWQLGALLHLMLWRTAPGAEVPPAATSCAALDVLVARLLAPAPDDRPRSALEVCEALARIEHVLLDADYGDDALALVDALCARPGEQAWASICRFLLSRPDAADLVERAAALLHAWPDELRRAPLSWWQRMRHDGTHPLWPLARTLDLSGQALDDDDVTAIVAQPGLSSITRLALADNHIGNRGMGAIARAKSLSGLRALVLRDNRITDDGVACLPGVLRQLTQLDLANNGLGARGAELIAAAPLFLTSLDLAGNDIGTRGAEAIAASDHCSAFEWLCLADNSIGSDGASAIATSRSLARLRHLDLSRNRIGPAGAAALALSANVSNLASLSLAQNALGLEGLELLLSSHKFSQLETIDVSSNDLGPQGAMALSSSPLVRRVKSLALADNRIGDAGLAALLGAPFLSALTSLDAAQNAVTAGGIALLRGAPLELSALDLSRNPLGREGLGALAATLPRMRLRHLRVADCEFPSSAFGVLPMAAPITLRSLDIAGNRLGDAQTSVQGPRGPHCHLDTLDVSRNGLSATALAALLQSPATRTITSLAANANAFHDEPGALAGAVEALPSLVRLELRDCRLTAAHIRALVRSGAAGRLRHVDLAFNQLTDAAAAAVAEPPGCHALHALVLDHNDISFATASSILVSPAMPLLHRATFARNALKNVIDLHSLARRKIELLEQSFAEVTALGPALGERFYARLFERYPALKPLFAHTPMRRQQQHLVSALGLVIEHLRAPDQVIGALEALAARHVGYGAYPSHYHALQVTMVDTLREVLGPRWSIELEEAWHDGLAAIASVMIRTHARVPVAVSERGVSM